MPKIKQFKNWTLMSPGMANGVYYPSEAISIAFQNTKWDKKTQSLSIDHLPNQVSTNAGEVKNLHIASNGDLKGDIYIYDLNTINKLESGARYGISPELDGYVEGDEMKDFKFLNFSVVFEPAVKTTYLNSKSEDGVKHIKTSYLADNYFGDKEILIEQAIDPAISRFCFVDDDGNICRHRHQNRRILNMDEDVKEPEKNGKEEVKPEEKPEEETNDAGKEELSEIKALLTKVLQDNKELKEEVKKKYPPETEKKLEDGEEPEPEEKPEEAKPEEKPEEVKPEEVKPEEEGRQVLGEELAEEIFESLSIVNSEYTDFVKAYLKKHKGEGTIGELMKKAAKEWKDRKVVKEEEKKEALKEQRETVTQPAGEKKVELSEQEMDTEVATFFLDQQETYSQKVK